MITTIAQFGKFLFSIEASIITEASSLEIQNDVIERMIDIRRALHVVPELGVLISEIQPGLLRIVF